MVFFACCKGLLHSPTSGPQNHCFRALATRNLQPRQREAGDNTRIRYLQRIRAGNEVSSTGASTSVPVRVALELLQAGHHYLDVRTAEEFSAGHPAGAVNVPYMLRVGKVLQENPRFLEEVSSRFRKDDEIIIGCQVGKRSLMAATALTSAGFTGITNMAGGFAFWVENGLPTGS